MTLPWATKLGSKQLQQQLLCTTTRILRARRTFLSELRLPFSLLLGFQTVSLQSFARFRASSIWSSSSPDCQLISLLFPALWWSLVLFYLDSLVTLSAKYIQDKKNLHFLSFLSSFQAIHWALSSYHTWRSDIAYYLLVKSAFGESGDTDYRPY